jgi:glycosyltransferase involved in cell wall biosynthesis
MTPFSLILPCFNEIANLDRVVARSVDAAVRRGLAPEEFRLVLVENGSGDGSLKWMERRQAKKGGEFLQIVPVTRNQGYGHGLMTGLRAASPGILATSHADQQCDPEDAFRGWELLRDAPEKQLVKGARTGRPIGDRLFSLGFELAARQLLGPGLSEINAQPKVFPSDLVALLTEPPNDFAFDLYLLVQARAAGYRIREIDVRFPPRVHGTSNWSRTLRSRTRTSLRQLNYMAELREVLAQKRS